ncbi:60S ribosomal export protein NMD3 [Cocos nucifera]|uniref:60S ribosomal export protein NMD3 n=1 Tax=Cocos nucifera TaxID=13894 RepID=A0A8K0IFF4_COCNU|nr:60S ribosomal export protein NMD3 [Cocos nucifera]
MELGASGMFVRAQTVGTVLCCICGVAMAPNPANMCVRCLRSNVDITEGLPRRGAIVHCPECRRYLHPPSTWVPADPESKELLAFCLRRLSKLLTRLVRLVHAEFVWTEPHSKRLRLKLRVRREVLRGAILEQSHLVELTVQHQLCPACSRAHPDPDRWSAAVQLRQHVAHRRTFFFLEQLILHHGAAARALRVAEDDRGLDFFFGSRSHAHKFVDFISGVVPVRSRYDKQLVSHDPKSNVYNYKHTFSVEICPICREDLICLPADVAPNLGRLVICTKISNSISLLDPFTLQSAFLDARQYWRVPFKALLSSRQLVEYIVLDIEVTEATVRGSLASAQVARVSDYGKNDNIFTVRTHLGHLLNPGDYALGYDLHGADSNDLEIDLPDAVLLKKSYEEKRRIRSGKHASKKRNTEYEFSRDLEEKPELRLSISLYSNKDYRPSEMASKAGGDNVPSVPLGDLLADLDLSD